MINHVLFNCDIATELWEVVGLPAPSSGFGDTLEDNIDFVFQLTVSNVGSDPNLGAMPWYLWAI